MDTIMIIRDSVATCVNKTAEICQPCVKEAGTTWQDVAIAFLVCLTLYLIVRYVIYKYYQYKKEERKASADAAQKERENDIEDREWRIRIDKEAHELRRKEEMEAHELKRKEEQDDHDKNLKEKFEEKLSDYIENCIISGKAITPDDKYLEILQKRIDATNNNKQ